MADGGLDDDEHGVGQHQTGLFRGRVGGVPLVDATSIADGNRRHGLAGKQLRHAAGGDSSTAVEIHPRGFFAAAKPCK